MAFLQSSSAFFKFTLSNQKKADENCRKIKVTQIMTLLQSSSAFFKFTLSNQKKAEKRLMKTVGRLKKHRSRFSYRVHQPFSNSPSVIKKKADDNCRKIKVTLIMILLQSSSAFFKIALTTILKSISVRVSVQGVKSLGGHFANLFREFCVIQETVFLSSPIACASMRTNGASKNRVVFVCLCFCLSDFCGHLSILGILKLLCYFGIFLNNFLSNFFEQFFKQFFKQFF